MSDTKRSVVAIVSVAAAGLVVWLVTRERPPSPATTPSSDVTGAPSSPAPSSPAPGASSAPGTRLAPAPVYVAADDGFEITFPSLAAPTIDRGEQETSKGKVPAVTYYVTYGASAFSVSVARHPHAAVAAKTPEALARTTRDDILARTGAKIAGERPFELLAPGGKKHPGLYQELVLPRGLRALYAIVFVCDAAYTLSAAGPAGDPSLDAGLFAGFVASLKITKTFGCERGG